MHRALTTTLAFVAVSSAASPAAAQNAQLPIRIDLATGTAVEEQGRGQLERILTSWDLSRWLFTRAARIEADVIPHSHPVLTVNTRYLANDTAQLATFVHEQLHWFFVRHQQATDSAIAELERLYPDAPDGPPAGARDLRSTYLHLLVCLLEFDAVKELFGEEAARRTIGGWQHYPWVYGEVLQRPEPIRGILQRYRLGSPDARS